MDIVDIRNAGEVRGKRVLLRASLNVPVVDGRVRSDFRLSRTLETVNFLRERGAVTILLGHIGRDPQESLRPVFEYLTTLIPLTFIEKPEELPSREATVPEGSVYLLENLRHFPGEAGNESAFAESIALHGDLFVTDAFSDAHREHASIVTLPRMLPRYAGLLLSDEISNLNQALSPVHPALFILGGAKFETKAPLIRKFLDTYDRVFVGGALANDLFKAKGFAIGRSLSSEELLHVDDVLNHPHLMLPEDVVVEHSDGTSSVRKPHEVAAEDLILDAGPATVAGLLSLARSQKFILWNGPLGNYERGYKQQTETLARGLAESGAACVVGGGDTVASIAELNLGDKYTFISTGGGAMLEYLQKGTLPGIEALKN